jgi:hypothetical protein
MWYCLRVCGFFFKFVLTDTCIVNVLSHFVMSCRKDLYKRLMAMSFITVLGD